MLKQQFLSRDWFSMHLKVKGRLRKAHNFPVGVQSTRISLQSVCLRFCTTDYPDRPTRRESQPQRQRTKEKSLGPAQVMPSPMRWETGRLLVRGDALPAECAADLQGDHWFIVFLVNRFRWLQGMRIFVFWLLRLARRMSNFLQGMTDWTWYSKPQSNELQKQLSP